MRTTEVIASAVQMAEGIENTELAKALQKVAKSVEGDTLKVVVLGDFKAGKSTLINTLFLKQNLLPTDILEATSVPTHISNGSMKLQTWLRSDNGSESLQSEWTDFTQEKINSLVTAGDAESRRYLAEKYSRVSISMPNILPEGITLVDTPGLNTPNDKVYIGTMQEARTAHAILYMVQGKQLSEREETLLADLAGMQQPALPIHVVLTLKERQYEPGQIEDLRKEISAQLASVGMPHTGVSVFTFGNRASDSETKSDSTLEDNDHSGFDIAELLDGIGDKDDDVTQAPTASATGIRDEIVAFLQGAARQGKRIRQLRDLRPLLQKLETSLLARIEFAGKSEQEIAQLRRQLDAQKEDYELVICNIIEELKAAQISAETKLLAQFDGMKAEFEANIQDKKALDEVGDVLRHWSDTMPKRVSNLMKSTGADLTLAAKTIGNKYKQQLSQSISSLDAPEFSLDSTFLSIVQKTPGWLIDILDFIVVSLICPTGIIGDLIARFLGGKIIGIRDLMPTNIAGRIAKSMAISKFDEFIDTIKLTISERFQDALEQANKDLETKLAEGAVFPELQQALDKTSQNVLSETEKSHLQQQVTQVRTWLENLQ